MRPLISAALLISLALNQAGGRPARAPDVLLITLDTTRADRMGFLGSARGLTPALDALARTGTYPPIHGVDDFGAPLPAFVPYLPDLLRRSGYRTAAFVGSIVLDPRSGTAPGFDRGFSTYDAGFALRNPGEDRYHTLERRGDEVAARAVRWLTTLPRSPSEPFFAWVHLFDPHDPYDPPADLKQRFAAAPYDGEIAAVDRAVGTLVAAAGGDALIVVAG